VLPFADHITVLSGNGHIVNHDFSPVNYGISDTADFCITASSNDDSDKEDATTGHSEESTSASVIDASKATITDASRQTGDMSVYLYYSRAAGLTATACFLMVTAACTFCESFAGELQVHKRYSKTPTDVDSALASMVGRIRSIG
jgi:ATP-binding cassette subfamily C (CFTR/MRP) protein 1